MLYQCTGRSSLYVLALLVAPQLALAREDAPKLFRGPYLQCATPESIVIVWRTDGSTEPVVRIGDSPDTLDRTIDAGAITLRVSADVDAGDGVPLLYKEPGEDAAHRDPRDPDPSTAAGAYQYEARVDGLKPSTRYYYSVYDGDRRLAGGDAEHYFETSPPRGSDAHLRIWVVGDSGTGERDQRLVHQAMMDFIQKTDRDLDLYLHVGDMAYGDGTDREFQHHFFDVYQPTLRQTACWPAMGNHEGHTSRGISGFGPYYDAYVLPTAAEAGGVSSGSEAYYSFDVADVHFVCLDSHDLDRSPSGAMAQWLIADLEEAQGDWLIAFWHHPPYTKGSHDSDGEQQLIEMRTHIMPILESSGVDLVLTGHSHIYERSMLIDGAYATPTTAEGVILDDGDGNPDGDGAYRKSQGLNPHEGTVAIVSGHGGASLSRKGTMPVMREIIVEHGSVILDIDGDTLTGTMINKEGAERDLFRIVKQGRVDVERLADPWQPVHDPSLLTDFVVTFEKEEIGRAPQRWSVVRGAKGSMTVQERPGSIGTQAFVSAADRPFIAVYDDFNSELSEFETRMQIPSCSAAPAGLVFGYQDDENYFAYCLVAESAMAELICVKDGKQHVLTRRPVELDFDKPVKIELESVGKIVEAHLQDELEYTLHLGQQLPKGQVGLYVGANGTAKYELFVIERKLP